MNALKSIRFHIHFAVPTLPALIHRKGTGKRDERHKVEANVFFLPHLFNSTENYKCEDKPNWEKGMKKKCTIKKRQIEQQMSKDTELAQRKGRKRGNRGGRKKNNCAIKINVFRRMESKFLKPQFGGAQPSFQIFI